MIGININVFILTSSTIKITSSNILFKGLLLMKEIMKTKLVNINKRIAIEDCTVLYFFYTFKKCELLFINNYQHRDSINKDTNFFIIPGK